jgi:hypothetical protein
MSNDGPKSCYGLSWSNNDPRCAGGLDPTFVDDDGSHQRPRCDYFSSCGARRMARDTEQQRLVQIRNQQVQQPQVVPIQAQTQPQQQIMMHPSIPPALQQHYMQLMSMTKTQTIQQQQAMQPLPSPQIMPYGYGGVSHLPVPSYMPVNYYMPPYLSVPEPYNGSYTAMIGRTVLRSMLKSVGHSVASVLDTVPFGSVQQTKEVDKK